MLVLLVKVVEEDMKRVPYEPPSSVALGKIFEPIERQGNEFVVQLTETFFELPSEARASVLDLLAEHWRRRDDACRELVLYDARDGHRIGTFSRESGLQLI